MHFANFFPAVKKAAWIQVPFFPATVFKTLFNNPAYMGRLDTRSWQQINKVSGFKQLEPHAKIDPVVHVMKGHEDNDTDLISLTTASNLQRLATHFNNPHIYGYVIHSHKLALIQPDFKSHPMSTWLEAQFSWMEEHMVRHPIPLDQIAGCVSFSPMPGLWQINTLWLNPSFGYGNLFEISKELSSDNFTQLEHQPRHVI